MAEALKSPRRPRRAGRQPRSRQSVLGKAGDSGLAALGRASRQTLQAQVYDRLKSAVMTGVLAPGQPVSIRGLASALGTSPIPVREALRHLAAERAVEVQPNGSVAVPEMTRARFEDLRRTRLVIEGFATELAAASMTPATIRRVEGLFAQVDALHRSGDVKKFLAQNQRMRFVIYQAIDSPTLMPIIESLWLQVGPFFNLSMTEPHLRRSLSYDLAAINALKRGDGPEARKWIERDISETGDYILSLLKG